MVLRYQDKERPQTMLGYQRTPLGTILRSCLVIGALGALVLGAATGCGSDDAGSESADTSAESLAFDDTLKPDSQNNDSAAETQEVDPAETGADAPGDESAPEEVADNQQPGFDALPSISVKMGHQEELDLSPYIDDAEDDDADLVLSWSAVHVGLQDKPEHVLLVVGPVDWYGEEIIELTITDTDGASASAMLKVEVEEVKPPDPITPPVECPKTLFSYTADGAPGEVLLAGTFNDWSGGGDAALPLADPEGDGTWLLELDLAPGTWLYKYVVDGAWLHDSANPETVDDGYGGFNSVVVVPDCDEGGQE
jgi:hypothetical protein